MSLERNLKRSFAEVRRDILEVKNQVLKLAEMQEKLEIHVQELKKASTVKKSSKKG